MPYKFDISGKRVWIAGETGMVGRALVCALAGVDCTLLSAPHEALNLTDQAQTYEWLSTHQPDLVIMAAAKVGGIGANAADPAGFLYQNLAMTPNVIHGAYQAGVERLLYLGSSCIYPKEAAQPIKENTLLSGALEETNEAYALAKICGLKLCAYYHRQYKADYIAAMPCNLYGVHDRFDAAQSHVIPAMLMKFHAAKQAQAPQVTLWGTGKPLREFLYVDDLAQGLLHLIEHYNGAQWMNIGSGAEISIEALAHKVKKIVGYEGEIIFDETKPDGTMRKLLDNSKIKALGWHAETELRDGLRKAYEWFLEK